MSLVEKTRRQLKEQPNDSGVAGTLSEMLRENYNGLKKMLGLAGSNSKSKSIPEGSPKTGTVTTTASPPSNGTQIQQTLNGTNGNVTAPPCCQQTPCNHNCTDQERLLGVLKNCTCPATTATPPPATEGTTQPPVPSPSHNTAPGGFVQIDEIPAPMPSAAGAVPLNPMNSVDEPYDHQNDEDDDDVLDHEKPRPTSEENKDIKASPSTSTGTSFLQADDNKHADESFISVEDKKGSKDEWHVVDKEKLSGGVAASSKNDHAKKEEETTGTAQLARKKSTMTTSHQSRTDAATTSTLHGKSKTGKSEVVEKSAHDDQKEDKTNLHEDHKPRTPEEEQKHKEWEIRIKMLDQVAKDHTEKMKKEEAAMEDKAMKEVASKHPEKAAQMTRHRYLGNPDFMKLSDVVGAKTMNKLQKEDENLSTATSPATEGEKNVAQDQGEQVTPTVTTVQDEKSETAPAEQAEKAGEERTDAETSTSGDDKDHTSEGGKKESVDTLGLSESEDGKTNKKEWKKSIEEVGNKIKTVNNVAEQEPTEKADTTTHQKSDPSVTLTELKAEKEVDEKEDHDTASSATSPPEAPKDHSEDGKGEDEATTPGVPLCTDAPVAEGDGGSRDENTPTTSIPACSEPPPGGGGTPVYDGKPKINPVSKKKTGNINKVVKKENTKSFLQTDNEGVNGDDDEKLSSKDDQNNNFLSTSEEKGQQHDAGEKTDEHEDFDVDDYDELNHHLDPHHDYSEKSTTHVHNPADHPDAERDFHKKGKKLYDWSDYDWPEDNGESKEWDGLGDDPQAEKNEVQHGEIHHDWDGFGDDPYLDMLDEEPLLGGHAIFSEAANQHPGDSNDEDQDFYNDHKSKRTRYAEQDLWHDDDFERKNQPERVYYHSEKRNSVPVHQKPNIDNYEHLDFANNFQEYTFL
ncbi:unnamed protein product [Amoebophrya sp. A120]|nr:unnamed protein product [Amoebophrya sp. A120]|eukprot:GSA120T00019254001.1